MNMIARQLTFRRAQALLLALVFGFSINASVNAKSKQSEQFPSIKISNFGQMDERFYRGAQPKESDYQALADLGIKTIIDLRDDPTSYEKRATEAVGMQYVNIPMSDKDLPSDSQIDQFLKLVNNPETGKFYVHCAGGRHRTGVMGAVYRYNFYNWNYDQAYAEMKNFDFYTRWGHGAMKDYVVDYYQRIQAGQIQTLSSIAASATN